MIDLKKTAGVSEELEIRTDKALLFRIIPVFSGGEAFGIASRVRNVYKTPLTIVTETPIDTSGSDYGAPWLLKCDVLCHCLKLMLYLILLLRVSF